jgi:hypothetical protein
VLAGITVWALPETKGVRLAGCGVEAPKDLAEHATVRPAT